MKEIVVISGKGGTGKTSVTAALARVADRVMLADCDVDAADLHLILKPQILRREDFYSGFKAVIDPESCLNCGACLQVCRFDAIRAGESHPSVAELDCEGCGYCSQVCPVGAISLPEQLVGESYLSDTRYGCQLSHARLGIGADNSGKLVARVKKHAREAAGENGSEYILVDGSPGIGCPVISSLSGADFVLLVTEPTLSGLNDLKRVWQLTAQFQIPAACLINKADLNMEVADRIKQFLFENKIRHIADIPYDGDFVRAITLGQSLVELNPDKWQPQFTTIWNKIIKELI